MQSLIHEIYKSFDCNPLPETRVSKAFDKVWNEGLIFTLKTYGIDDDLLKLLINKLEDCKQRVVLNGQICFWKNTLAGAPQGSALGPILFAIYLSDLSVGIKSICKVFVDDTSFSQKVKTKIALLLNLTMI